MENQSHHNQCLQCCMLHGEARPTYLQEHPGVAWGDGVVGHGPAQGGQPQGGAGVAGRV